MKKSIKRILIGMIFMLLLLPIVKAEQICKIYEDYDLFLDVTSRSNYETGLENSENGIYHLDRTTYTPAGLSKDSELIDEHQVNILTDEDAGEILTSSTIKWSLSNYWARYKNIYDYGVEEEIETSEGTTKIRVYTSNVTSDSVTRYIVHGKWFDASTEQWQNPGVTMKDVLYKEGNVIRPNGNARGSLNNISIIPTGVVSENESGTTIQSTKGADSYSDLYKVKIDRYVAREDIMRKDTATITMGTEDQEVFFAPAAYYRKYEYCTSVVSAKITIIKRSTKKDEELPGATLVIKDENGDVAKDINGNELQWVTDKTSKQFSLLPGTYTLSEVEAPEGYELSDKEIEFVVNEDGDVLIDSNKLDENTIIFENTPKPEQKPTGDSLIYVAWFVGLAAIGFVAFYYIKERKASLEL